MTVLPFVRRGDGHTAPRASDSAGASPAAGLFGCPTGGVGAFCGTYRLGRLVSESGEVVAIGVFTGELVGPGGKRIGLGSRRTRARASISVSDTTVVAQLDPLEVNLLGFTVRMQPVNLDLDASLCSIEDARELVDGPSSAALLPVGGKELLRKIVAVGSAPRAHARR